MLNLDPKVRPSAADCLTHKFFQTAIDDETELK